MKKLLVATDSFLPRPDGIAIFLKEVLPRLKGKYDITVLAPDFGDLDEYEETFIGIKIIRFPLSKLKISDYTFARPKKKMIKEYVQDADLVLTQTLGPIGVTAIKQGKKQGKPVIAYVHSIEWELFSASFDRLRKIISMGAGLFVKRLYNKCDLLLVASEKIGEVLANYGIKTRKEVIQLGVDVNFFIPPKTKAEAKKKIGINPRINVIGFVGRIAPEKNLKTLFEAAEILRKKYDNFVVLIVGLGILSQIPKKPYIKWVGEKHDVLPYYQAMDIYVLPSLTETTSLTTLEAMSCEVAVVCTPVGMVKEYVKTRQNGWLFPVNNVYRLNLVIDKLLGDADLRESLGKNARKTVLQKFRWSSTTARLDDVFSRM